jgi:hypothetical protein
MSIYSSTRKASGRPWAMREASPSRNEQPLTFVPRAPSRFFNHSLLDGLQAKPPASLISRSLNMSEDWNLSQGSKSNNFWTRETAQSPSIRCLHSVGKMTDGIRNDPRRGAPLGSQFGWTTGAWGRASSLCACS